jgi:hypothetical protein
MKLVASTVKKVGANPVSPREQAGIDCRNDKRTANIPAGGNDRAEGLVRMLRYFALCSLACLLFGKAYCPHAPL